MINFFQKDFVLESKRLILRPLKSSDRSFIKELYNPSNVTYLHNRIKSAEYREKYVDLSKYLRERKTRLDLVLVDKKTDKQIGLKQLNFYCQVKSLGLWRGYEIQYDGFVYTTSIVDSNYRNKGYMTEATSVLMSHLFKNKVRAVVCDIDSRNTASIAYHARLGFAKVSLEQFNGLDTLSGDITHGNSLEERYVYVNESNYKNLSAEDLLIKVKDYPMGPPPISI